MNLLDHLPHLFFSITAIVILRWLESGRQDISYMTTMSKTFYTYIESEKDRIKELSLKDYHEFRDKHFRAFRERITNTRELTSFLNNIFTFYFMVMSYLLFGIDSIVMIALVIVYTVSWKMNKHQKRYTKAVEKTQEIYIHRTEAYLKVFYDLSTNQLEPAQREWVIKKINKMDQNIEKSIGLLKTFRIQSFYTYALLGGLSYLMIKQIGGF